MPQIFHPWANTLAKCTLGFAAVGALGLGWWGWQMTKAPWNTEEAVARPQPVPFSHEHHVRGLGIDCRYCHTSVESSAFAGLPPTKTCMTCHSQIWRHSPMLAPVRESYATNTPLRWTRVHDLPDYVYFNHAIHVNKGVGCNTCHGAVDQMPLLRQGSNLLMEWCLSCHRNPEPNLRPRDQVVSMEWKPPPDQKTQGAALAERYHVRKEPLTNCSVCHR